MSSIPVNQNEIQLEDMNVSNDEKFLFFFKPDKIDNECIGGISLKNGVRVFSVIVLLKAFISFYNIFELKFSNTNFIISLLFFICYLFIGSFALISTFNNNLSLAKIAYKLICIFFILEALVILLVSLIIFFAFINPWDEYFFNLKILLSIIWKIVSLFIYLYFIYVLFCFISELKRSS